MPIQGSTNGKPLEQISIKGLGCNSSIVPSKAVDRRYHHGGDEQEDGLRWPATGATLVTVLLNSDIPWSESDSSFLTPDVPIVIETGIRDRV